MPSRTSIVLSLVMGSEDAQGGTKSAWFQDESKQPVALEEALIDLCLTGDIYDQWLTSL